MMPDTDARSAAILAECLVVRLAHRVLDVCAVAWANSRTRRILLVDGDQARFWSIVTVTAVIVVALGSRFGLLL